jgi:hypothetical protein
VAFRMRTPALNVIEMRFDFKGLRYLGSGYLKITLIEIRLKIIGSWIIKQKKFSCN